MPQLGNVQLPPCGTTFHFKPLKEHLPPLSLFRLWCRLLWMSHQMALSLSAVSLTTPSVLLCPKP